MDLGLLRKIDAYLDAAPRPSARTETVGPFTLFLSGGPGWPYYARPVHGGPGPISAHDVGVVRARQRALDVPETFEWVAELAPDLAEAATSSGLQVVLHQLMLLAAEDFRPVPAPEGVRTSVVAPDDDLTVPFGVAMVAFSNPGTEIGEVGHEAVRQAASSMTAEMLAFVRRRMEQGLTITAIAAVDGRAVAVGSHNPIGDTTEIVGVGTLPAFRREGLGATVTSMLVQDALARRISTVLLSAGDEAVARVYARLGFHTVGTAGAAAPADPA